MGNSTNKEKMTRVVNIKLIEWLSHTFLDKSYKKYSDCHLDEIIKHYDISNFDIDYWQEILINLGKFCEIYKIPLSIVLNIPLEQNTEHYEDISKNIAIGSMPSFYLIDKEKLLEIKSSDIKILNINSQNNLITYISKYYSVWREDELIITCQVANFTKHHRKIFEKRHFTT